MPKQRSVGAILDLALDSRFVATFQACSIEVTLASIDDDRRAKLLAVAAFGRVLQSDFDAAFSTAAEAAELAAGSNDAGARLLSAAISSLANCTFPPDARPPGAEADFELLRSLCERADEVPAADREVALYIAIETAMSAGALALAQQIATDYLLDPVLDSPLAHVFARIALCRSLAFQGAVAEAHRVGTDAVAEAGRSGSTTASALARASVAYCAAQLGRRAEVERETALVVGLVPRPRGYIGRGAYVLGAFALAAVGNIARAATMMLSCGGGPRLHRLQTVDRAYGYELLATAAIERGDLPAARAWGRRADPLQIHDMAAAAVERTLSRIDVAMGDYESGAERAAISAARALVAGGRLDAARSRVLAAAALAASGDRSAAVAGLNEAVLDADELGAEAIRSWSTRELRRLGRRPRPRIGSGWTMLSAREHQIALLAAEGYSNRMIGRALYLSERTVQSHLSRVFSTLGTSKRSEIPGTLTRHDRREELPELTDRQSQLAELIAEGLSNREIAERLSISQKTVEKHIQGIFLRWHVGSRTAIANQVLAGRSDVGSEEAAV
jgi:DNA-binding NarL/FixJ family response regulator